MANSKMSNLWKRKRLRHHIHKKFRSRTRVLILILGLLALYRLFTANFKTSTKKLVSYHSVEWMMLPLDRVRKYQFDSLHTAIYAQHSQYVSPIMGKLDVLDLCTPVCRGGNMAGPKFEFDMGSTESCLNKPYLEKVMEVVHVPGEKRPLVIVVPFHHGDKEKVGENLFKDLSQLCHQPTDVELLLLSVGPKFDPLEIDVSPCIKNVRQVFYKTETLSYARGAPTMFKLLLEYEMKYLTGFEYFLWLEPDTLPIGKFWLNTLLDVVDRGSPYLIKGSPCFSDSQMILNNFGAVDQGIITAQNMHINGNALYGSWNLPFLELMHDILTSVSDNEYLIVTKKNAFDSILNWFWFNEFCNFKTLSAFFVFDNFILNSPRVQSLEDIPKETILVHKPLNCSLVARKLSLRDLYDEESDDIWSCYKSADEQSFEILSKINFDHELLSKRDIEIPQDCIKNLGYHGRRNVNDETCSSFVHQAPRRRKEPRIVVTVVFSAKQYKELVYAVSRLQSPEFFPCKEVTDRYGLLFIQSDPWGSSVKEDLLRDIHEFGAVLKCFSEISFQFIDIPDSNDGYKFGPPEMFKEMMLGVFSDNYDFALQIEPDVFPIRAFWLNRISEVVQDDDAWVKGSLGLYPDKDDFEQGCIQVVQTRETTGIRVGPVGPRLVHINGNAIYSLSHEFRNVVRDFYDQAMALPLGLCPREDRMVCRLHMCSGSFDTSLAEYIFLNQEERLKRLTKYRFSDFLVNDIHPFIPLARLKNRTTFMHKPWKSIETIKTLASHDDSLKAFVEEQIALAREKLSGK